MGNAWSAPESWDKEEIVKWKERSIEQQKQYYNGYEGAHFHSIDCSVEGNFDLLKAKMCFALFGLPTEGIAGNLLDGYDENKQKDAAAFADAICAMYPEGQIATVEIITLFICCKSEEIETAVPVFRIRVDTKTIKYMDASKRIYATWQDWLDNNKLPMMKFCCPKNGFYSCSEDDEIEYEEDKYPVIETGHTPACNLSARVASTLDISSMFMSVGAGGVMIAGMFTPLAPAVMLGASTTGLGSALWGAGRSAQRLADKKQHEENMWDMESMMSMASIVILPMSIASSATNAYIANGVRVSGRVFTPMIRTAATFLNCTTLGLQSGMLALGLAHLVQKAEKKQLTSLDVLQFSMMVFFFTNTVMQPKTASGIIAKAQTEHVQQYRESMTDEHAQATFDRFVEQNRGSGGIRDMSKVVRSLNKIENPDHLFKGLTNADSIAIGGRKGNTLLVSMEGTESITTRMRVNGTFVKSTLITEVQRGRLESALKGQTKTEFGKRVLDIDNMEPHEAERLDSVLKSTCDNDSRIVDAAVSLSEDLKVENVGDFCALLELVNHEAGNGSDSVGRIMSEVGRVEFVIGVWNDIKRAREIASAAGMIYNSALKAVYHYRQHGSEFVSKGDPMDYYLKELPEIHFTTGNLRNVEIQGNIVRETYCSASGDFGVLIKKAGTDKPIISTVFKNEKYVQEYSSLVACVIEMNNFAAPHPSYISSLLSNLSGGVNPSEFLRYFHIEA